MRKFLFPFRVFNTTNFSKNEFESFVFFKPGMNKILVFICIAENFFVEIMQVKTFFENVSKTSLRS